MARRKEFYPKFLICDGDDGFYEPRQANTPSEALAEAKDFVQDGCAGPIYIYQACKRVDFEPVEVEIEQVSF